MVLILKSDQRRSERWQRSWDVSKTLPKNKHVSSPSVLRGTKSRTKSLRIVRSISNHC